MQILLSISYKVAKLQHILYTHQEKLRQPTPKV